MPQRSHCRIQAVRLEDGVKRAQDGCRLSATAPYWQVAPVILPLTRCSTHTHCSTSRADWHIRPNQFNLQVHGCSKHARFGIPIGFRTKRTALRWGTQVICISVRHLNGVDGSDVAAVLSNHTDSVKTAANATAVRFKRAIGLTPGPNRMAFYQMPLMPLSA